MRVGYARVSTPDQDIEGQLARLADCDKVYSEKASGAHPERRQLAACLDFVREGDTLTIVRLDRIARSVVHLCNITDTLRRKGVELIVLDQAIDTSTPHGKLLFHMLAAIAEFELDLRSEAQRAGMDYARARGTHMGRPSALLPEQIVELQAAYLEGVSQKQLARRYHVSARSVRRYLSLVQTSA